jgi:hypothetical protein
MNNLRDLKKFVISEMKNRNSDWYKQGTSNNYLRYDSKYIEVFKRDNHSKEGSYIKLNTNSDKIYIESFGLSEFRLSLLISIYTESFCKYSNKIRHQNYVKDIWHDFLKKNKDINRDEKLKDLGI